MNLFWSSWHVLLSMSFDSSHIIVFQEKQCYRTVTGHNQPKLNLLMDMSCNQFSVFVLISEKKYSTKLTRSSNWQSKSRQPDSNVFFTILLKTCNKTCPSAKWNWLQDVLYKFNFKSKFLKELLTLWKYPMFNDFVFLLAL